MRMESLLPGLVLALTLLLSPPQPATALGVAPDPLPLDQIFGADATFVGSLDFLGMGSGVPDGGTVLAGAVAPGDVTFLFQISLDPGAGQSVAFFSFGHPNEAVFPLVLWTGIGTIPGPGADLSGGSIGAYASFSTTLPLSPGATTNPIFLSIPTISVGEDFLVAMIGTGGTQAGNTSTTIVPEPGGFALRGLGIASLALLCWSSKNTPRNQTRSGSSVRWKRVPGA